MLNKLYPHRYPAIITKTLFEQVQTVKSNFNKKQFKYAGKPYIYRGLIRCAQCGLAITPEKHKGHVYYHCTQYNGKHDAKWLREEEITRQLGSIFKNLKMPQELLKQTVETMRELHQEKIEFHNKHFDDLTSEQKKLTKMMDNLYLDKLQGSITESEYDRFYQTLRDKITDVNIRLDQLQEADDNYYITSKYILDLTSRAYELFKGSEVEEKRQLIKLILSNLELDNEKLVWEAHKPFNLILNMADCQTWCARQDSNLRPTD
jgi:site-specific DNA recombinase